MSQNGQRTRTNGSGNGHGGAAPSGPLGGKNEEGWFEELVEAGVDKRVATSMQDLLSKDFVLGNVRRRDREYLRYHAENIALLSLEEFPPEGSRVQGAAGAALLGEPSYNKKAMSEAKKNRQESLLLANFFRSSRSENGWQQDKFSEQRQVQELHDSRQEEESSLIEGIFG